jgi:hypothetical protein
VITVLLKRVNHKYLAPSDSALKSNRSLHLRRFIEHQ